MKTPEHLHNGNQDRLDHENSGGGVRPEHTNHSIKFKAFFVTEKETGDMFPRQIDLAAQLFSSGGLKLLLIEFDGTLWSEQPAYSQIFFAFDRIKTLAPQHPEWKEKEPFASVLKGDMKGVAASGEKGLLEIVAATHVGMSTEEFEKIVEDWITTAKHPKTGKLYTEMVYQPMLELLAYLRANGFKTFIVSGGGIEFIRPWTERVYGVPPEQVVGSSVKTKYELKDGKSVLTRLPEVDFIDDKIGKPVGINSHIGRRPIAAFGNSDGDQQMLEWTQAGHGSKLMMLVHHDDAEREWAYGPNSKFGTFSNSLMEEAGKNGWTIISMNGNLPLAVA